jgi:hypothetical protein
MKLTGTKVVALYLHSPHTSSGRTGPTTRNEYAFVRGWLRYFCSRLITSFCSRLITSLLFAVDYVILFAVDYITFVRGWLHYFCLRLITLLSFAVDCVTCRGRMQCRYNTEEWRQGVVRYWSSAWRTAWRTQTHTQMKEERQRRQQNTHTSS